MKNKKFLKAAIFCAVFFGLTMSTSAQVTISGGFALSNMEATYKSGSYSESFKGDVGFGGNIYFDYLLPVKIPMSLGFEFGIDGAKIDNLYKVEGTAIPLSMAARSMSHINTQ